MEPKAPEPNHIAGRDLLAGYALGILTPEEHAVLTRHLASCADCQAELAMLRNGVAALPLGLDEREPSPALRGRLEAAILADAAAATPPPPTPFPSRVRSVPINVWAIAAAILLVISATAVGWGIRQSLQPQEGMMTMALEMTDAAPDASGELAYLEQRQVMILTVDDLPPLPPDQVYEVWMITQDGEPLPSGTFSATSTRHAMVGDIANYQAVTITMEPGPMGTMQPTSDPLVMAPLTHD